MKKKSPKTIAEHFDAFDAAMVRLHRARCCDCDLIGLEQALELARVFAVSLPRCEQGEMSSRDRSEIELAYHAIVIVAIIACNDVGMRLMKPSQFAAGHAAARRMLEVILPYVGCGDLAVFDDEIVEAHAN